LTDEVLLESQVTYLYDATAKKLYNLALYSIEDQPLAEQLTIDAFASTFTLLVNKSDVEKFRIVSTKALYHITKKTLRSHNGPYITRETLSNQGNNQAHLLLSQLNYNERFMLLLYIQQRFSRKQIAQILHIPKFMVKKRLHRMLNKTANIWAKLSKDELYKQTCLKTGTQS